MARAKHTPLVAEPFSSDGRPSQHAQAGMAGLRTGTRFGEKCAEGKKVSGTILRDVGRFHFAAAGTYAVHCNSTRAPSAMPLAPVALRAGNGGLKYSR